MAKVAYSLLGIVIGLAIGMGVTLLGIPLPLDLVAFLNNNSGAVIALFSIVAGLATAVYAGLTWRLVTETRRLREAQTEPKISVIYQPREEWINFIDLVIQNIGLGPAYEIRFKIKDDFEYMKGELLSQLGFIKRGIDYLAPDQKIKFFLTSLTEDFKIKMKSPFRIDVSYYNKTRKPYNDGFLIDFSEMEGLGQLGEPPIHKIADNIEKIQKDINALRQSQLRRDLRNQGRRDPVDTDP
ncbi:MAG: hypothetical protein V3U49_02775 [Nitrososphaerales archaeon]